MTLKKADADTLHRSAPELTPAQRRTHLTLGMKRIEPFTAGDGFLSWCMDQGWVVRQGKRYFAARNGLRELRERRDIPA